MRLFQDGKGMTAKREYDEGGGRLVCIDKFRTDEEKKEQKRLNSAACRAPEEPAGNVSRAAPPIL